MKKKQIEVSKNIFEFIFERIHFFQSLGSFLRQQI